MRRRQRFRCYPTPLVWLVTKPVSQIPLDMLAEPVRSKIQAVIERPTLYRRMPPQVFVCEPDLYLFLVRYPEVVVNMWQLMGITRVKLKRTGQFMFDAADGAGTTSRVELVYGTREQHLLLAEGFYDGPLVPRRVTGRCVLLFSSEYSQNEQQQAMVSHRLDVFVQIDNLGVEVIAKTLHPLIGKNGRQQFCGINEVSQPGVACGGIERSWRAATGNEIDQH